jgi:hypothetical protein
MRRLGEIVQTAAGQTAAGQTAAGQTAAGQTAAGQTAAGRAGLVARHTSACLAGADLPEEEAMLTAAIQRQGWSQTATVANDTFAVLRAGLTPGGGEPAWDCPPCTTSRSPSTIGEIPVVLGGGVLEAENPLLTGAITRRLAALAPAAVARVVDTPPVTGAALLGLDYLHAPSTAETRLRAARDRKVSSGA